MAYRLEQPRLPCAGRPQRLASSGFSAAGTEHALAAANDSITLTMYRVFFLFAGVLIVSLLILRSVMLSKPVFVLSDNVAAHAGSLLSNLPPSGYRPGHLLRDTLKNDLLHTPPYMSIGHYAYRQYLSAPLAERRRVADNLQRVIYPMDRWLDWLNRGRIDFVCIGESHQENYRRFLAEQFFPHYRLDVLFLEARELPARVMGVRADIGEGHVDLLNADIANIIRATKANNPDALIFGIEESTGQKKTRRRNLIGSRDQSIYENIIEHYVPGQRTAALLGALHCNDRWDWLYTKLEKPGSPLESANLLNIRLLSEGKDLLSRELTRFLSLLGYPAGDYVFVNTQMIDPLIHQWFLNLTENLTKYQSVVLFQSDLH